MKRLIFSALLALPLTGAAQVSYTGGVYLQDFNTLQGTTNNTANVTWTDNSTLPGWYSSKSGYQVTNGTMGGTAATFDATNSANNIGMISFGSASSTDRALGSRATSTNSLSTTNAPVQYGVRLVNSTAQTITSFSVMFTGEQWYASTQSAAHTLQVDYSIGATSLTSGTYVSNFTTFTAPVITGTTARSLDGNSSANRRGVARLVTGLSWAPGQDLWLRITDTNESGNEQGLAIDDFVFTTETNSALFFNGSSNHVTMGAATSTLGASVFTLEAWIYRTGNGTTTSTGTGGVTAYPVVTKGRGESETAGLNCNYFMGIDTSNRLVADFEAAATSGVTTGQNYPVIGTSSIPFNQWTHIAATYDGAATDGEKWKLYINGVKDTTSATAGVNTIANAVPEAISTQHFAIGTAMTSGGVREGTFLGLIDEVRVWNVARTSAEILAGKDAEITTGTGLLGRYGFAEGTGTTAASSVAGSPAGTLVASPVWMHGRSFTPNNAPTVAITAPVNGFSTMAPATVSFTADAADGDGSIAKVEFFNGVTKIGEDTTAPYQYDWSRTNADTGTFSLTAKATDNGGAVATSAAVSITITPNSNQAPVITLSTPANAATGIGGSTMLNANLSDNESDAMTVTFYGRKTTPAVPGPDFTIATLPDTQFYSENLSNNGRAATFHAQTQWLVDNRDTLNLAFVSHMGDIVQNGDAVPAEWTVADESMKRIENQVATLRAYGIPWGAAPGNHDQTSIGNAGGANVFYNNLFGASRYAGRSYWGGNESLTNNNNNYQVFSASGLDFIILHLEYDARAVSSYQVILDWADAVMKAFPNRRAIVTSHWIVNTGNPATFSTQGQAIYDNLKDNPNFFLMLCGHVAGEGQRSDTFQGRTVHSVLQDYQGRSNGGDGWLRYFTFSPTANTISAKTYRVSNPINPAAGTFETDADSQFTLPYNMQSSLTDWIPLGTANVAAAGTSASLNWTGLEVGSNYEWYATANDGTNLASSSTRRFSTTANVAPTVSITTPVSNATINLPATVNLTANAADTDGSIARVEFYQGAVKLSEDLTAPYEFVWAAPSGAYALTAVAVDNTGAATLSSVVNITVVNASNMLPTVAITSPANNASFEAGTIALEATASDTDGTIAKVEFFNGATKLGEDTTAPHTFSWTSVAAGSYSLTAVATDNDGGVTTSSAVAITVTPVGSFTNTYSQNFSSMGTAGTTPPAAWTVWNGPGTSNTLWTAATGIIGGPSSTAGSIGLMTLSSASLTASNAPTANANNGYNAGAPGDSANRMLGSAPTSLGGMAFQVELTNISAAAISNLNISYDIQRFTAPTNVNDLPGYWLFYSVDSGATWSNVSTLNPVVSGGTINVPNTVGVTNVPPTVVNLASPWTVGGTLRLRWVDDNAQASSPDQIFGLDNVSITLPQPAPTVALTAPANNASVPLPGPVNLAATAADANGTVTKVEFFAGPTKLGEDTTEPYEFAWSGMISGAYVLTARATDNDASSTTSAAVNVTVTNPGNVAPAVAIASPLNNALVPASSLTINATASDTDGVVSKVEFYNGATKLGEDTSAPFTFTWVGVPVGTHSLTAVATDNDAGVTTSTAISVNATAFTDVTTIPRGATWKYFDQGTDLGTTWKDSAFDDSTWASGPAELGYADAPVTTLREGPDGLTSVTKFITYYFRKTFTVTDASQVLALAINLLRDDGAVVYLNGVEVARSNMPAGVIDYLTNSSTTISGTDETTYLPFTLPASALVTGSNVIAVELHQRDNASSDLSFDMDLITTLAGGNALPLVSITSPANNASFLPGNSIPIVASATDSDGTITKVEFFNGATKLGEDLTSPYEFTLANATAGTYTLTSRATDDFGSTATSAAVTATVTLGPSGTLARGPYLNMPNHNSIVVRWRSSQSVVGRVRYGTTSTNLDQFTDEATAQTNHVVRLTGLTPHTRYYYSVGSATDALTPEAADTTSVRTAAYTIPAPTAADYTFRTSPTPGTATNTRIWVVGDCGRGSATQASGRDAYYNWMGSRVPDLNLQLGDNAYNSGTDSEYQTGYFAMYPTIFRKMPQWSTLGNHDANNTTPSGGGPYSYPYFDMFTFPTAGEAGGVASGTEHYYSFDYGNIHFICLDSNSSTRTVDNPATTGVNEDGPMATWLRQDLASTTRTWIIAFFHHPPYSKGSHDSDTEAAMVQMRTNFNPILETGGVDLVLCGHSHNYERSVLLDGNYGTTGTITAAMKKNAGNGSTTGFTTSASGVIRNAANGFTATATVAGTVIAPNGAYMKPLTGPRDHFGAVYNTAGMSGLADAGAINHSAMYISYNQVGTVNLDINGNTLVATFIQSNGSAPDNYTIVKQGAADTDGDGLTDEFELANGLNRNIAADSTSDGDGDGISNFVEFAFGTNPSVNDTGTLEVSGNSIVKRGSPVVTITNTPTGVDFRAAFCRRKDQSTAGLTYTVQFSADLSTWQSSVVVPTVIADDGTYQVVAVKYPFFVNGQKARFFRVTVTPN